MVRLADAAGDPFSRDHYVPGHFTASAFVLSPDGETLLLLYHKKLRRWLQPGGHIEPGDIDLEAAARREVLEEVGLGDLALAHDGIFDLDVHAIPERGSEPAHQHHDVRYLFRANPLAERTPDEMHSLQWVPVDRIADVVSDDSVLRAVRKLRAATR